MEKKKKAVAVVIALAAVLFVAFVPYSWVTNKDGGTREVSSFALKYVNWNKTELSSDNSDYSKKQVYFFPDSLKSIDELWEKEKEANLTTQDKNIFFATVKEVYKNLVFVEAIERPNSTMSGEYELQTDEKTEIKNQSGEQIALSSLKEGDKIQVAFHGEIAERYPALILHVDEIILLDEE